MNAADAMPEGGTITIETFESVPSPELLRSHPGLEDKNYCIIKVKDTGVGMAEEVIERIFEPFFTTKERGKGTGLGLPITLGIIRNHGGIVTVNSKPGAGAVFNVFLPASDEKEHPAETDDAAETRPNHETIMIVDDDSDYLDSSAETLELDGFKPITADSGPKAIEIYNKSFADISLILLDVRMPEAKDGKETYDALKRINPNAKILICTGYSMDAHTTELADKGARHFLQKPYGLDDLRKIIREIIDEE
jgi:two-component system, cell cycle sensor histidine kinase and response regulator CckA